MLSVAVKAAPENDAGEVTFLLGQAFINGTTPVSIGSKVGSGDVIQTLGNGHVHIRFIDGGLVSVRPESRLAIEHYGYNETHPSKSVIKFNLEEGVMRSISGNGAKAARDKFRLNTPIAAIGVRGTDFVIKASDEFLQAFVNEGAIIVAPYSDECTISSIGPCQANTVELSSLSNQLLEFSSLEESPMLLSLSTAVQPYVVSNNDGASEQQDNKIVYSDSSSSDSTPNHTKIYEEKTAQNSLAFASLTASNASNVPTTSSSSKIAWGRFGNKNLSESLNNIITNNASTKRFVILSADTLSDGRFYSYRPSSSDHGLNTLASNVEFNLAAAEASLTTSDGSIQNVAVLGGKLNVDFVSRDFTTQLNMYNKLTSNVQFNADGTLNSRGFFISNTNDTSFSMLTTTDGEESSYYFKTLLDAGAIEGITFWHD